MLIIWKPTAIIELTSFEKLEYGWRAPFSDQYLHPVKRAFHRLPLNENEAVISKTRLLENNSVSGLFPSTRGISRQKPDNHAINFNDGWIVFTTSGDSDPNLNGNYYELRTRMPVRLRVKLAAGLCLAFMGYSLFFTSLRPYLRERCHAIGDIVVSKTWPDFLTLPVVSLSQYERRWCYILGVSIGLLALFPAFDHQFFLGGKYLIAEDLRVFLAEAQNHNISAIWTIYGGYLWLYQRLVALIAGFLPLGYRPDIYFAGFIAAYALSLVIIIFCSIRYKFSLAAVCLIAAAITLQPHDSGEVVCFIITNTGWMLGLALTLYMICLKEDCQLPRPYEHIFLFVTGLTGVHSLLLIPVLSVKVFLKKDFKRFASQYALVAMCGLVQLASLLQGRATEPLGERELLPLVKTAFLFGAANSQQIFVAIAFWGLFFIALIWFFGKHSNADNKAFRAVIILCFISMAVYLIAAFYYHFQRTGRIFATGRYTWIPYGLLFFSALTIGKGRWMGVAIAASIISVCLLCNNDWSKRTTFRYPLAHYTFSSFAEFSYYKNIVILDPRHDKEAERWALATTEPRKAQNSKLETIDLAEDYEFISRSIRVKSMDSKARRNLSGKKDDANWRAILIRKPITFTDVSHIGVEITLTREEDSRTGLIPLKLYWGGRNNNFGEYESRLRWYPFGRITAHFAFPKNREAIYLLLDPYCSPEQVKIENIMVYRLP